MAPAFTRRIPPHRRCCPSVSQHEVDGNWSCHHRLAPPFGNLARSTTPVLDPLNPLRRPRRPIPQPLPSWPLSTIPPAPCCPFPHQPDSLACSSDPNFARSRLRLPQTRVYSPFSLSSAPTNERSERSTSTEKVTFKTLVCSWRLKCNTVRCTAAICSPATTFQSYSIAIFLLTHASVHPILQALIFAGPLARWDSGVRIVPPRGR